MKRTLVRLCLLAALPIIIGLAIAPKTAAQNVLVNPTPLYRFEVSYWDGGHLLTGVYLEGPANGYTYDPIPYPRIDGLGIYVPPPGYTPLPGSFPGTQLVPLHRWTVIEDGWRTHYYYSTYYTDQPANRYYNGIAGWVFPPNTSQAVVPGALPINLYPLSVFYSSDLGFWNGAASIPEVDFPPNREGRDPYHFQGLICYLPPMDAAGALTAVFAPPGGGGGNNNGDCNPPSSSLNACQHNGGWWNYDTCQCEY
jgi:hypothetical protein